MGINWDDYVPGALEAEKENECSSESLTKLKSNLTDKIAEMEGCLKKIVSKNAKIYNIIADMTPITYKGLNSLLRNGKSPKDFPDKCITDNDYSNFHNDFSKITKPHKSGLWFYSLDGNTKIINQDFNGSLRNISYEALYNGGSKKYSYKITTFSSFYASCLIGNIDHIMNDELSFHNYNNLSEKSTDIFKKIDIIVQDSENAKKQKILFRYLMERGTGISFSYFLYKYALMFYDELIKEKGISKKNIHWLVNEYLLYMTMFKSVCIFPNGDFLGIITKFVTHFMRSRNRLALETNYNSSYEAAYTDFFYNELLRLVRSLFEHQEKCLLAPNNINIDDAIFSFPKLSKVDDKKSEHKLLWKNVLKFVRIYVDYDNPANSLDLKLRNNSEQLKTLSLI